MKNIYTLLALLVSIISFAIIFASLKDVRFYPQADEGYYFRYASYIADKGVSGFPDLFKEYIENKENWIFSSPIRAGFILLSSGWLKIFGPSFLSLAYLSLFSFFCFLLVSFYFAKRHFGEETAFLLLLLLAFSPLNMGMARRALTDSTANLFISLSIWLFLDLSKNGGRLKQIAFILVYSFTILTRESAAFLSPVLILYLCILRFILKKRVSLISLLSITIFPALIVIGILTILSSGQFYEAIKANVSIFRSNQYSILFCAGPWFRYLIDWLILSPWTLILSIGFIFYYLTLNRKEECPIYFITIFCGLLFIFGILTVNAKNARYAIMLETPIRLFSILMLEVLFRERLKPIVFAIIVIIAFFDYWNFTHLFIKEGIYDPVSTWLLRAKDIIPR